MFVVRREFYKDDAQVMLFSDGTQLILRPHAEPQAFVALRGWRPPAKTAPIPRAAAPAEEAA